MTTVRAFDRPNAEYLVAHSWFHEPSRQTSVSINRNALTQPATEEDFDFSDEVISEPKINTVKVLRCTERALENV